MNTHRFFGAGTGCSRWPQSEVLSASLLVSTVTRRLLTPSIIDEELSVLHLCAGLVSRRGRLARETWLCAERCTLTAMEPVAQAHDPLNHILPAQAAAATTTSLSREKGVQPMCCDTKESAAGWKVGRGEGPGGQGKGGREDRGTG